MKIHTVKDGETLREIARLYDVKEEILRETNTGARRAVPGRELLVLFPTRTHRGSRTDTVGSVSARFGVSPSELRLRNPWLRGQVALYKREIAIKFSETSLGAIAALGYCTSSTTLSQLVTFLPYITYFCLYAYKLERTGIKRLFDTLEAARLARASGKVTLIGIRDETDGEVYGTEESRRSLAESMCALAKSLGAHGIVFSPSSAAKESKRCFAEFLMELRRAMIGCDLILFTECDGTLAPEITELSDGTVLSYSKSGTGVKAPFEDAERAVLKEFSERCEPSGALIELPSLARTGERHVGLSELFSSGRTERIEADEVALISRMGDAVFESLGNVKARLDLVDELGFMGISFDIGSVPIEYVLAAYSMFAPVHLQAPFSLPM